MTLTFQTAAPEVVQPSRESSNWGLSTMLTPQVGVAEALVEVVVAVDVDAAVDDADDEDGLQALARAEAGPSRRGKMMDANFIMFESE